MGCKFKLHRRKVGTNIFKAEFLLIKFEGFIASKRPMLYYINFYYEEFDTGDISFFIISICKYS